MSSLSLVGAILFHFHDYYAGGRQKVRVVDSSRRAHRALEPVRVLRLIMGSQAYGALTPDSLPWYCWRMMRLIVCFAILLLTLGGCKRSTGSRSPLQPKPSPSPAS